MEYIDQNHQLAAAFIARVFLACLFFFQGFDAVFRIKIKNVILTYQNTFANSGIPKFAIIFASWFTSCSALIGGFLVTLGLFEYIALYLLGINLIVAAIGFGINTPMWDTRFVLPRMLLLLFLLLIPQEWNVWSLDWVFLHK